MILPSASKIELALSCQHPWTSGASWPKDGGNQYLDFGNACHDTMEGYVRGDVVDLDAIADARSLTVTDRRRLYNVAHQIRQRIDGLTSAGWMLFPEVAVAFHVASGTGRIMRKAHHRDYSDARPGELTGTLDVIGIRRGEVFTGDLKTGRWKSRDGMSWQLRFGAVAVASILGADEIAAALWYVDEDGMRDDDGVLDCFDLAETAAALKDLWTRLTGGPTPPVPGPWCCDNYCALLGRCAATRAALAEVRTSAVVRINTPEDAARVWEMLPHAEAAVKAAKEQIKAMAARGETISLSSGKRLAVVEQCRESLQCTPEAVSYIELAGAMGAVEHSTSKAAIERALPKPEAKNLIETLRKIGAVRESRFTVVKEIE